MLGGVGGGTSLDALIQGIVKVGGHELLGACTQQTQVFFIGL